MTGPEPVEACRGRILVVDDTPANLRLLIGMLAEHGYAVHPASSGELALRFVEATLPDLVLLDAVMPGMDGYQVCERLKASERTRDIPVIFVSAGHEVLDKVRALTLGAVDYVVKPLQEKEVLARIETHLSLRSLRRDLEVRVQERTAALTEANALLSREIAERKAAEAERERLLVGERLARAEAELASRAKDEFLANLSHELRTPLTAILGWAQLLRTEQDISEAEVYRGLETIERNARAQAVLVKDLLDLSYVVAGQLRLEREELDLAQVVDALIETLRPALEAKQIVVERRYGKLPRLLADPLRLQQIVWNLLSNAIKFTPAKGRVQVALGLVDGAAELSVSDTGIGIPAEFLPRVFDRFLQADASSTRRFGGLGLGLAIVRHLVELHGGTVRAASDGEGRGTTMSVILPLVVRGERTASSPTWSQAAELAPPAGAVDLAGVSVLVVDDEPDALQLVQQVLRRSRAEVQVASSVAEALAELDRRLPNVLVSDIGMPDEDGYSLIRRMRERSPERGGGVPALALTAFAHDEDRSRALRAGYQAHLPKPFQPRELLAQVARLSGRLSRSG